MRKRMIAIVLIGLASNTAFAASEGEYQASAFANIYASLCLKHLNDLDALRDILKPVPKLPPEKAAHFLSGKPGDAWPVPDKHGTFVLALPTGKNMCLVYARRADTEAAKKQFLHLVAHAPAPLVAKPVSNAQNQTAANGTTHTIAYEWAVPKASRKLLFTLTTASSESAQLQVLGSAAIVSQ